VATLLSWLATALDAHRRPAPRHELIDDGPAPGWHRVSFGPSNDSGATARAFDGYGQEERPASDGDHFTGFNLRRD